MGAREMLPVLFHSAVLNVGCVHRAGNVPYALGTLYPKTGKLHHSMEEDEFHLG